MERPLTVKLRDVVKELGGLVDNEYYIIWAFEEAIVCGALAVELVFSRDPYVALTMVLRSLDDELVEVRGIHVIIRREACTDPWNSASRRVKDELSHSILSVEEGKDYIDIMLFVRSRTLSGVLDEVRKVISTLKSICRGVKAEKLRIIGYNMIEP